MMKKNIRLPMWTRAGLGVLLLGTVLADSPPALGPGETLPDHRVDALKDLNGYFPFEVPATVEAWKARAEVVRERLLVSQGLVPMPAKTPLNPVIHGKIAFSDYSVEKVYFESFPGYFVTGNLYRPIGRSGPRPGVLCPHGHWSEGRFMDNRDIRSELSVGAERFENGGRSVLQARCVQLARMGCVVFHYDMIGYADSVQISYDLAHRFAKQRANMNDSEAWGFFSPQAESQLQSIMGLQTWNSIRSLDFLESLPEVDAKRLAVTGASGGGTQTFMLGAIDPRPAVAFPAVMVSTAMQGGCTCENASLLRVGTGNVEIAGLFAPKPLGLTGANDWTVEMASKGFPELQQLYQLLGKPKHVQLTALNHFGHNYNYVSRSAMYRWLNRHLDLGVPEPIVEEDYGRLGQADLTVWNASHPVPDGGEAFERNLLQYWHQDSQRQLESAASASPKAFAADVAPALATLVGRTLASSGSVEWDIQGKEDRGSHLAMSGLLKNANHDEAVPVLFLYPKEWGGTSVLWLSAEGKAGLYGADGELVAGVRHLLDGGATVVGVDLLFQGESASEGKTLDRTRRVANPREAAAYTFGYNSSLFARRVHDVLSTIRFLTTHDERSERIALVGLTGAGHWAAVARSVLGESVDRYAIDTEGFRFGGVTDLHAPEFLPGGAKYLDVPGFLIAGETQPLWLRGESDDRLAQRYQEAGRESDLQLAGVSDDVAAVVAWLLK